LIETGNTEENKECSMPFSPNNTIIKVPSHPHPLKKHPDNHHTGWRCDKLCGA